MGSSIVIMCFAYFLLISLIIEAKVVDLPSPVGPVTNTNPCLKSIACLIIAGRLSCFRGFYY